MTQDLGPKKVQRLREQLGLPIKRVVVRGNRDHAKTLILDNNLYFELAKDGTLTFLPAWGSGPTLGRQLLEESRVVSVDATDTRPRPPGDNHRP